MIIQLNWATMSSVIDNNLTTNFFYSIEDEYTSNGPETNTTRYFVRQTIGGDENHCFVSRDGGADDLDFITNYKILVRAIETL